MVDLARKRVQAEKKEILKNPPQLWILKEVPEKWNQWIVQIKLNKINTPYHSVPININIKFSENYPQQMPLIRLENPHLFFHPNIDFASGYICQVTVKNTSMGVKIKDRIEAVIRLFSIPNCENPLNWVAAQLCQKNERQFYKKAFAIFRELDPIM